jgi:hypothetical protein
VNIWNRPGLSRISFRIGTFATFREAMLEAIATEAALAALTTRESDDYAITILELSAAVWDVLSFYNERVANQLFLRTATERDSLLRLVRLIGYQLRPGLAATAPLAFELDDGAETRIRRGLKVMSVPGQDERPQTYETLDEIIAHADLNSVPVFAPALPFNAFQKGQVSAPLAAHSELTKGDPLVFYGSSLIEEKTIEAREELPSGERLHFTPAIQTSSWWPGVASAAKVERRFRFFGYNAPSRYQHFDPSPSPGTWQTKTNVTGFSWNTATYQLDGRYEDLKPGTRLLIDAGPKSVPQLRTAVITETREEPAVLGNIEDTVTSATLRQTIRGRPTIAAMALGIRVVVARGGAGTALLFVPPSSWAALDSGFVASSDVCAVWMVAPLRLDVFARDASGRASTTTWTVAGLSPWTDLGGVITSAPKALALATDELVVFARGLDFALWMRGILPASIPWASRGGLIASDPAPVSWGGSRIDVFVRGFDRGLWHMSREAGSWSEWNPLYGKLTSAPAAASTGVSHLDVVALDDDGCLIHRRWKGDAWTDWLNLGGKLKDSPAILATGPDRVDVFARGADNQLWQIARTGEAWSPWIPLGGSISSAPDAVLAAGAVHICARDSDGSVATRSWTSAGWGSWGHFGAGLGAIADRREARIYQLAADEIAFRDYDYPASLSGGRVAIRLKPGQKAGNLGGFAKLTKGRSIVLESGTTKHLAVVTAATPVASAPGEPEDHLVVDFAPPLPHSVADAFLKGNIAPASHGETQPDDTLGNGDAAKTFLKFRLSHAPLTYLPSKTSIDGTAALEIRVSVEKWQEVPSLYGRGPTERIYTARRTDAGDTIVTFGDGRTGARVPTGAMNIVARYRRGIGLEGRVKADQLSTPLERPVGLRAVTNPLPADGGADPETRDNARNAAPTTVRTFGRIVSLRDFEWLATSSGLASRAFVTWVWLDLQRAAHLTVAGSGGSRLSKASLDTIYEALTGARDPNHHLLLANLVRVPVVVRARIVADLAFDSDVVMQNARVALNDLFSFEAMPLGAAVHASHVYAALQMAKGVAAVGLDVFNLKGFATLTAKEAAVRAVTLDPVQPHIRIFPARPTPDDASLIDRYARVAFDGSVPPPVLPAEQAYIEDPRTDVALVLVGAL